MGSGEGEVYNKEKMGQITVILTLNITTKDCQWRLHSAGNFANLAFLLDKFNNRSSGLKRSGNKSISQHKL